jgi:hypothetical protein
MNLTWAVWKEQQRPSRLNLQKALMVVAAPKDGPRVARIRTPQVVAFSAESLRLARLATIGSDIRTDGWLGHLHLKSTGYQHNVTLWLSAQRTSSELMPRVHRVISPLKG